jgi:MSHA biogenesis protein MshE
MVLSTLHTNDAIGTVDRLIDMGAEGYLIAATLRAIVGQRLLRRVCTSCRQPTELDDTQRAWLESLIGEKRAAKLTFQAGKGCAQCNRTGYQGRIGIYEILELTAEMRTALRRGDTIAFAEAARRAPGYKPLVASALELAARGTTTVREVERISGEVEELLATHNMPGADRAEEDDAAEGVTSNAAL